MCESPQYVEEKEILCITVKSFPNVLFKSTSSRYCCLKFIILVSHANQNENNFYVYFICLDIKMYWTNSKKLCRNAKYKRKCESCCHALPHFNYCNLKWSARAIFYSYFLNLSHQFKMQSCALPFQLEVWILLVLI